MNVRKLALDAILKIRQDNAYSNIVVNDYINQFILTNEEKGLFTNLVYGTIQYYMTLEYYLEPFLKKKPKPWVKNLLCMSVYQIVYLAIPDYATINEAVNIARIKDNNVASFVNAVLRNFTRTELRDFSSLKGEELLSIKYSHPLWLVRMLIDDYGIEKCEKILIENSLIKKDAIRINTIKANKNEVMEILEKENIAFEESSLVDNGLIINQNLSKNELFIEGLITIQDISSQMVSECLNPNLGATVLDLCSAPGGKSAHIAALMQNTGIIYACDIYPHKIKLMESSFRRLGITNIRTQLVDARDVRKFVKEESVDYVLLDAPCSGLGVISHKVDLKYHIAESSIKDIIILQKEILEATFSLVKRGGYLLYSTCTINKNENERQIRSFLDRHEDFEIDKEKIILPYEYHTDGFYICKLRRKNDKSL